MSSNVSSRAALAVLLVALASCDGGSSNPQAPTTPPPTPTPAPTTAGTIRLVGSSLADGSTVKVTPMFVLGQQAPQLSFTAGIMMRERRHRRGWCGPGSGRRASAAWAEVRRA